MSRDCVPVLQCPETIPVGEGGRPRLDPLTSEHANRLRPLLVGMGQQGVLV